MDDAVSAFIETCDVQLGWTFREMDNRHVDHSPDTCRGSTLALSGSHGTWILIVLCDDLSSQRLTRLLFAMDDDEEVALEDTADALNEIINVAAGVFKKSRDGIGERLGIGLPTYLDGDEAACFLGDGVRDMSRMISTQDDVRMKIIAFWQEGAES